MKGCALRVVNAGGKLGLLRKHLPTSVSIPEASVKGWTARRGPLKKSGIPWAGMPRVDADRSLRGEVTRAPQP